MIEEKRKLEQEWKKIEEQKQIINDQKTKLEEEWEKIEEGKQRIEEQNKELEKKRMNRTRETKNRGTK